MNALSRMSSSDTTAYLVPGAASMTGLLLLVHSVSSPSLVSAVLSQPAVSVIAYVVGSYVLGVLQAIPSYTIARTIERVVWRGVHVTSSPPEELRDLVSDVLRPLFAGKALTVPPWSSAVFYVCRSLVLHVHPASSELIRRQGGLRQLRTNLIGTVGAWSVIASTYCFRSTADWGCTQAISCISAILLAVTVMIVLLVYWSRVSHMREVREVATGLVAARLSGSL